MNAVEQAIVSALQNNSQVMAEATAVCYGAGHKDTKFPFVVLAKQARADADVYSFWTRVGRRQRYVAKAVDLGMSKQRAQTIADAVDAVLTNSQLSVEGWGWLYCRRSGDVEYSENLPDGQMAWHVGGIYEITLGVV